MKRYVARGLVFGAIVLAVGSWGAVRKPTTRQGSR